MVHELRTITESQILRSWALAETNSIAFREFFRGGVPQPLWDKIESGPHNFSEDEWQILEEAIRAIRSPLLKDLLPLGLEWYTGTLPEQELQDLELMNWDGFSGIRGSRKLIDLVRAYQEGGLNTGLREFIENLDRMWRGFRLANMKGMPIIVGRNKRHPYILVEGYKRSASLLLNMLEGISFGGSIPVILGTSNRLEEWIFYRDIT